MTKLVAITIKLPPTMLAAIDERVQFRHGHSRTACITRAIEAMLLDTKLKRKAWIQIRNEQRQHPGRRVRRQKGH